jgi:hypothetical protein
LSDAAIAVAKGDDEEAARVLAAAVDGHKVSDGRQYYNHLRRLPLLYVLLPETRGQFEALDIGPCYRSALRLSEALVALRERATSCRRRPCGARTGLPRRPSSLSCGSSSWPAPPRPAVSQAPRPVWPTPGRWPAPH